MTFEKAIEMLEEYISVQELEKLMPKKPIIVSAEKSGTWMRIDCPLCNAGLRPFQEYCDCCGQRVDWSDEKK